MSLTASLASAILSLALPRSPWPFPWASLALSPVALPSTSLALPLTLSLVLSALEPV